MEKEKRVPLNRLVLPGTFDVVKRIAQQKQCSEGQVVDAAVASLVVSETALVVSANARSALRWWAKADETQEVEIAEQAIEMYDSMRQGGRSSLEAVRLSPAEAAARARAAQGFGDGDGFESSDPTAIPGVQVGVGVQKNASCRHCGEKFAGPKRVIVCPECKAGGHADDPHGCSECFNRDGPG